MAQTRISATTAEQPDGITYSDVYRVTGAASDVAAKAEPGIPTRGDRLARDPRAIVENVRATYADGSSTAYDVTVEARYIFPDGEGGGQQQPQGPDADAQLDAAGQSVTVDVWRVDGTDSDALVFPNDISSPPKRSGDTWWDMGGEVVDAFGGEPVGYFLKQMRLTIPVRWSSFVPVQVLESLRGTRNVKPFDVYAAGKVFFDEYNITRNLQTGRASGLLTLVVDPWSHLRQRVVLDQEGNPLLYPDQPPFDESVVGHARYVQWYQPFPNTADLNQLLRIGN